MSFHGRGQGGIGALSGKHLQKGAKSLRGLLISEIPGDFVSDEVEEVLEAPSLGFGVVVTLILPLLRDLASVPLPCPEIDSTAV